MNSTKKKLIALTVAVLAVLGLSACNDEARKQDEELVNEQMEVYSENQPVPFYDYSRDRDMAIQLYDLRNEALSTWSVFYNQGSETPYYVCPSRGFPIPADTQLTNPSQVTDSSVVVEQAEPNGLYSSENTDATWVLCVREDGVAPVYVEGKVTTFTFPVKVVNGEIVEDTAADSTATITENGDE